MDNAAPEPEKNESDNETEQIPSYQPFTLYGMVICGIIISLTGVYTKIAGLDKNPSLYYNGDDFQFGAIDGTYYIVTGIIICLFPAWHLIKGNHKVKKGK
jgi:hypothetical protein